MTYGAFTARDFASFDLDRRYQVPFPQAVLCALALTISASAGLWVLYAMQPIAMQAIVAPGTATHLAAPAKPVESKPIQPNTVQLNSATPRQASLPSALAPLRRYAALLDPTLISNQVPVTFAQSAPLRARFDPPPHEIASAQAPTSDLETEAPRTDAQTADASIVPTLPAMSAVVQEEAIPMPAPRPALFASAGTPAPLTASGRRAAQQQAMRSNAPEAAAVQPGKPGFFEKFFGGTQPPSPVLAYANPEDGGRGGVLGTRSRGSDNQTAIYDISAHTVYLPDGTRLEAHSGLGASKDDPRSVAERMRGATPPSTYELTPREAMFHGVRALRLTPVGDGNTYGRGGLLAHTFMLGPRGDSNGCVVFRNYKAFLDAYDSGQIRRLQVVARAG